MSLARLEREGDVARLVLARPERHNSLVPELLADLLRAIAEAAARPAPAAILLQAERQSFMEQIDSDEAHAGMARFLARPA